MKLEMPGIEPGASRMQSERSTAELHPHASVSPSPQASLVHLVLQLPIHRRPTTAIHGKLTCQTNIRKAVSLGVRQDGGENTGMRQPGFEPGSRAWEARMMPLHYWRDIVHPTITLKLHPNYGSSSTSFISSSSNSSFSSSSSSLSSSSSSSSSSTIMHHSFVCIHEMPTGWQHRASTFSLHCESQVAYICRERKSTCVSPFACGFNL
ncbi:unnamed protein product [Hymenolepis diminuta]|uniref:Uncharacterized protein n=1 Tax=Hymenolepis diminuta TaxID=6216 RepID=A0A564Y9A5_HYMDI|nr:unnamed protein product [Hymenolepis diminuta]